jgi:hypothetical protein
MKERLSYSKFTLALVKEHFDLRIEAEAALFAAVEPVVISNLLAETLKEFVPLALAINTEKARSEWIIAPILAEVRRQLHHRVSLFSGVALDVDAKRGLTGVCDFILSRSPIQYYLESPVAVIVEAKREDIIGGFGQCIAAMIGTREFNRRAGHELPTIYGAVTMGNQWKFLKLEGDVAAIDAEDYYLSNIDKIIGILCWIALPDVEAQQPA